MKSRRRLTYAELLLVLILGPLGVVGIQHLYGFVSSKVSVTIQVK
jgi:hypothetical protein